MKRQQSLIFYISHCREFQGDCFQSEVGKMWDIAHLIEEITFTGFTIYMHFIFTKTIF